LEDKIARQTFDKKYVHDIFTNILLFFGSQPLKPGVLFNALLVYSINWVGHQQLRDEILGWLTYLWPIRIVEIVFSFANHVKQHEGVRVDEGFLPTEQVEDDDAERPVVAAVVVSFSRAMRPRTFKYFGRDVRWCAAHRGGEGLRLVDETGHTEIANFDNCFLWIFIGEK